MITNPLPSPAAVAKQWFLARSDLDALIQALRKAGRTVIGPTVRDGAIVNDERNARRSSRWDATPSSTS